jgi:hypothetical protein
VPGGFELEAKRKQPWKTDQKLPSGITPAEVLYGADPAGPGGLGFQVATAFLAPGKAAPTLGDLKALHKLRAGSGTTPTVIAVSHGTTAWLFGPVTAQVRDPLPHELAQRYLQSVLHEPSTQAAYNRMIGLTRSAETTGIAGVNNSGLFASYHLRENAKHRADWPKATSAAAPLLTKRGQQLIPALGFKSDTAPGGVQILSGAAGPPTAVAILLDESQQFDAALPQFNHLPPVAFGLRIAAERGIPWLVVLRDDQVRLYPGKDGVGVGQKGQTETFLELDLAALALDYSALLPLVFSAAALAAGGSAQQLLDDSGRFASSLGARLRDRIYVEVIPPLAKAIAEALAKSGHTLDTDGLALAYRVTLHVLFRLLFQAYAEDRGLLPSGRNERYDANSLKTAAQRDMDTAPEDFSEDGSQLWMDLVQVWDAIDKGNKLWQVPAYNGGLFSSEAGMSEEGGALATITLPDSVVGPALQHLLVDVSEDGIRGPVDFRSLSVREFGTIYEGLLESSLSVAEVGLTVDASGAWVPAKAGDTIGALAGSVYFHSASGQRKATGSYFTPKIVVDHLIEGSVSPALTVHLANVADLLVQGNEVDAERLFFDFRVVDLAMGSGHFLVAAVDKVEALMRNFLTEHSIPGIQSELLRLAEVAKEALGDDEQAKGEVDNVALLRRQVARRCIYGLDVNPMAVELARLAMWIHTFVPGLPMSNLDHGLVCANSLTGIGTVDEALDALQPRRVAGAMTIFEGVLGESLDSARTLLIDMANAGEADRKQIAEAAALLASARKAAYPALQIFDAAVAARVGRINANALLSADDIAPFAESGLLDEVHAQLNPAHMPYLFPEVFLRENPGFDVVLGNPPWEEVKPEERSFWLRYRPGLFGLSDAERVSEIERLRKEHADLLPLFEEEKKRVEGYVEALRRGPYPGMGTGDLDLYKAFAWRNWQLLRKSGAAGFLAPRSLLNAAGSEAWRKEALAGCSAELVVLINAGRWAFDMEPRYSIAVIALDKSGDAGVLQLAGPFYSAREFLNRGPNGTLNFGSVAKATNEASIPAFADAISAEVFEQIRKAPRLDEKRAGWDFRALREFDATNDRKFYDTSTKAQGGVPVWGGDGYYIWESETGEVKTYANRSIAEAELQRKRRNQIKDKRSAFFGQPAAWAADVKTLPYRHPRIAFRGISQRTNQRTVIAALIPSDILLQNSSPYLFTADGTPQEEAFLLGFLCSVPLDWYARTLIETNLNLFIFNGFPVPPRDSASELQERVIEIAGRLAAVDERYAEWAAGVGVSVGTAKDKAEKDDLIAELDALVSLLYGLTKAQVEHVFATFHRGWEGKPDYAARITAVRKHYAAWKDKA